MRIVPCSHVLCVLPPHGGCCLSSPEDRGSRGQGLLFTALPGALGRRLNLSPRLFLGVCSDTLGPGKGTKCPWVSPRPGRFAPDAHRCAVQGLGDTQHLPPRPQTPWTEIGQEVPDPPQALPSPLPWDKRVPEVSATPSWEDPAGLRLWAGDTLTPGPPGLSPQGSAGRDRVAQEARPPREL